MIHQDITALVRTLFRFHPYWFRSASVRILVTMGGHDVMATEGEVAGEQAPPPVFHLTDKDKEILAMRDEDYELQTWDELRELICTSTLSSAQHYRQWTDGLVSIQCPPPAHSPPLSTA